MSLKTRLRVTVVALVAALSLAFSGLTLHSAATAEFRDLGERATATTLQAQSVLMQHLNQKTAALPPAYSLEEAEAQWREAVERDPALPRLLADILATSRTVLEIQVAAPDGRVLASSNPASVGKPARQVVSLVEWNQQSTWRKLAGVLGGEEDLAMMMPVGAGERIFFQIQVIWSALLMRNSLMPLVQRLILVLSVSLAVSVLLALFVSNLAFRPLARVGEAIDRIASGEAAAPAPPGQPEEVAVLEGKLQMLGQQFRGAKEDAVTLRGNVEQLLERLEAGVLLFDRNDRLLVAGRAVEELLGEGRWELAGKSIEELFPPSSELGAMISGAIGFRRPLRDAPVVFQREGREPLRLLVNLELLESFPGRERMGALISLRDAESRRQIGSQLDLSARLAAISRLTGGVAHEIKNPLNSIALHLEVLRARLEGQAEGAERELDVIAAEIARLDRVVKTFLDFTRPVDLHLAEVDAAALVHEIATLVAPEAAGRGVVVAADCQGAPLLLNADADLLKQALLNVVKNAVEAMTAPGQIEIAAGREAGECLLRVSDQGPGIPPEVRDKIFNLYFTTKGKGSGIGLAMTFRIVQLHNGTIDFTSEVGRGTTFLLRFPLARPASALEPGMNA
jgi:signal transduction histidine kinase